jgi:hypothetical protein
MNALAKLLEGLRAMDSDMTAGPWVVPHQHAGKNQSFPLVEEIVPEYSPSTRLVTLSATAWKPERFKSAKPNALGITAVRNALPALLAIIERAAGALELAKLALASCYDVVEWPATPDCGQARALTEAEAALADIEKLAERAGGELS